MVSMRLTYDRTVDMAYLYLAPSTSEIAHTEPVVVDLPGGLRRLVNLDFDAEGRLLGVEFDGARSGVPEEALRHAEVIG